MSKEKNNCRLCGACCIAPSISSPLPGMPDGKPAGVSCINLTEDFQCKLFGSESRPAVCREWTPSEEFCGTCREDAMKRITSLEERTVSLVSRQVSPEVLRGSRQGAES